MNNEFEKYKYLGNINIYNNKILISETFAKNILYIIDDKDYKDYIDYLPNGIINICITPYIHKWICCPTNFVFISFSLNLNYLPNSIQKLKLINEYVKFDKLPPNIIDLKILINYFDTYNIPPLIQLLSIKIYIIFNKNYMIEYLISALTKLNILYNENIYDYYQSRNFIKLEYKYDYFGKYIYNFKQINSNIIVKRKN